MVDINTTENRELLFKYLTKQYQREKSLSLSDAQDYAQFLMKNQSKNLFTYHGLAWELGSKNLEFFCLFFLSNIFTGEDKADIAPIHITIWHEIEDMILRKTHMQQNYLLPRGTGKSSFVTLAVAAWCSLYAYKRYTLICSAIGDTAQTFIRNIKMSLTDNTRIEECFGQLYGKKGLVDNTEQIELGNKTMIQSISASSSLRGKSYGNIRIELLLLDDYQKADEIKTHEQRESKWKTFSDDASYAIQKGNATLIACGTIQHKEDFYSRLKKSPVWKTRFEKGVFIDDIDAYFNSGHWAEFKKILYDKTNDFGLDHAKEYYFQNISEMQFPMLWQSYWDCLAEAIKYYENPTSFKQEFQGDVDSIGVRKFTTIIEKSAEEIESNTFTKTMLCIDPAASDDTKKKADYSAFVVGSLADNGIKYARKSEIYKFAFDNFINHTLKLLRTYKDITCIYIEKNTYMGADVLRLKDLISKDETLSNRYFTWINEMQRTNKDSKIDTIVADVNLGRIIFNEEDREAIAQLSDFAGCDFSIHDDFPDVLSEFGNRIDVMESGERIGVVNVTNLWNRR